MRNLTSIDIGKQFIVSRIRVGNPPIATNMVLSRIIPAKVGLTELELKALTLSSPVNSSLALVCDVTRLIFTYEVPTVGVCAHILPIKYGVKVIEGNPVTPTNAKGSIIGEVFIQEIE